ncbi:MAG: hypothetical protein WAP35_01245 [Solirubrobacterales bacterium]
MKSFPTFKRASLAPKHNKRRFATATAALVCLVVAVPATAAVIEVGGDDPLPTPACPNNDTCRAVTGVTGYQTQVGSSKNPYRVKESGKVVALTLKLPELTAAQKKFFEDNYEGDAKVKVSILRPRPRRGVKYRYVLAGQSESLNVTRYLNSEPTFPLRTSLTVRKNDIVALTVETWVPAFAIQLDAKTAWRASRTSKDCKKLDKSTHEKQGQVRVYGCQYTTAQLLYKATVIPSPKPTSAAPKAK